MTGSLYVVEVTSITSEEYWPRRKEFQEYEGQYLGHDASEARIRCLNEVAGVLYRPDGVQFWMHKIGVLLGEVPYLEIHPHQ